VGAFSGEKGWGSLLGISLHHGVRLSKDMQFMESGGPES